MAHHDDLPLRILHSYDLDVRQSYATLSRTIGPSRDSIRQIVRRLEDDRVIKGYITVIDIGKLGYIGVGVYARLDTTKPIQLKRFYDYLLNSDKIYWAALLGGRFDVLFAIQARSLVEFAETLSAIQSRFPFVCDTHFAIRTRATQFQRAYLNQKKSARVQGGFEAHEKREQFTNRELSVLNCLVREPRMAILDIARVVGISRITAQSIKIRLERRGVIQRYSALIDCHRLERESHLLLITLKRFDQATRTRLRRFAADEGEIIFCIESIGAWHTEFHCEVPSQRSLQELLRRFREAFPAEISRIEIIAGLDYYFKYRYATESVPNVEK